MPSDQSPATSEQKQLAEYQVWERVEARLWSRARMILIAAVALVLVVAFLGLPLIEERIARRVTGRAEALIAERAAANEVDVPALRQEIRDEHKNQRQELLRTQFTLEKRIEQLRERTNELQTASETLTDGGEEYEAFRQQIELIRQRQKNEEERLHKLRSTHERELADFRQKSETLMTSVSKLASRELRYLEKVVDRDLDELRLIIADQVEGKPAIYSSYVNLGQRDGQISGANFGEEKGNVFVRVRAFEDGTAEPFHESESIRVQSTQWRPDRINVRFPAPAVEKIQEIRQEAEGMKSETPEFRYGFLIQTTGGKMSQWSGLRVDSIVPPSNQGPKDN